MNGSSEMENRYRTRQSSEDSKGSGPSDGSNAEARVSPETNFSQLFKNNGKTLESATDQRKSTYQQDKKVKYSELVDKNRELSELFEEKEVENILENVAEDEVGAQVGNEMEKIAANEINEGKTEQQKKGEPMETDAPVTYKKKKIIMFRVTESEWLTEIPEDFPDNWLVKFCPKGSRRLVLCKHRTTKVFDKYGIFQMEFKSNIPGGGGNPEFSSSTPGLTALDCVFHIPTGTFFILDVMVWNCASFLDCEAELRHCWIRSKYMDNPEYFEGYGQNSFRFEVAFDYPADPSTIRLQLSQYDAYCHVACEGVLFYHKESPYIRGSTDRVTWLKPFMLEELMDITVPREYELRKPKDYVSLKTYLEQLEDRTENLKTKKKSKPKILLLAQRKEVEKKWKTEKMNMEITTIDAPVMQIPRRATTYMDTSAAQSSRMDFAP